MRRMRKDFSPEDRVRLKGGSDREVSLIPAMSCEQARIMADSFRRGALPAGHILLLGFHLVSPDVEPALSHTGECPSNDSALKHRIKAALRDSGE